jgi:hypothetical protein
MYKPTYFDDTLPEEQLATVWDYDAMISLGKSGVSVYNGIEIEDEWKLFKIPAGEAEFVMNVVSDRGNAIYKADDVIFRFNFEAGKEYSIIFTPYGGSGFGAEGDEWGINIYYGPPPAISGFKEEDFVGFAPFLNLARNSGPSTVLN